MKLDNASSAAPSAATSPSKPARAGTKSRADDGPHGKQPKDADRPSHKLSEAEFLKRQADDAKAALTQTLAEMKAKFADGADPVEWAREYPLISLGLAAAAGFIGTTLVVPSREQQALAKLAAMEKALHPSKPATDHEPHGKSGAGGNSLVTMIVREVFAIVRPVLMSLLTAGLAGREVAAEVDKVAANEQAKDAGPGGS